MNGQEVDILATRHIPGGGLYNVIIECKYKGGRAHVGNEDVQSIAGAYNIAKSTNKVSACTLVTTNGFSLAAQEAAKAAGIHLVTRRDLIRGLIDFSPYLDELKARYREDFGEDGRSWYIHARGRKDKKDIESLNEYVDEWLSQKDKSPLAILGGYGTGKSSFCRHYAVRLTANSESQIPIILPLRDFQKTIKMESLIRDFLDEQCDSPSPRFDTFWRMYREGFLLLIFDGFDEMAVRVDRSVLESNLLEIDRFARTVGNVILTCRPEFFITSKEEATAFRPDEDPLAERISIYERIEIALWTAEQVAQYVARRVKSIRPTPVHPPSYYIERIHQLPELADLSVRAVHLDLIVKMLPSMIDKGIPITRPNLYQTYIERELSRETVHNKRLKVISDDSRLALMQAVAAERFFESRDDLDFEVASRIIQTHLELPRSEVESVTRDFLNRSFLHREGDVYTFAHKSLGEYMFAQEVYSRIVQGDFDFFDKTTCSSAVAGMVLDLFGGLESFNTLLRALRLDSMEFFSVKEIPRSIFAAMGLADYLQGIMSVSRVIEAEHGDLVLRWRKFRSLAHDLHNQIYMLRNRSHILELDVLENSKEEQIEIFRGDWNRFLSRFTEFKRYHLNRLTFELEYNLERSNVDIKSLVNSAVACIPQGKAKITGTFHSYFGDEDFLSRVFENLALNAKYAIGEDGTLVVNVSEDDKSQLVVTFSNTGPQIPPENLSKIFDFGFTTRPEGHGIGLSVAKDLIEAHNGSIEVRSEPTKTEFIIVLPKTIPNENMA